MSKLATIHVFLLPYVREVYFSMIGAMINLKLKGKDAAEKYAKIPYGGISLYVKIIVEGSTKKTPCMKQRNPIKNFCSKVGEWGDYSFLYVSIRN